MKKATTINGWVIVGLDDYVFDKQFDTDRARVEKACLAVVAINHYKANQVRVAPAQLLVNHTDSVVFNEDPEYVEKIKAANLAKRKRRVPHRQRNAQQRVGGRDRR
jgi:hypothetical protein